MFLYTYVSSATLAIQGYLMMGRADIAQQEVEATKEWSDDALPLQLAEAWVNLSAVCILNRYVY